jgi:hypothetical protein
MALPSSSGEPTLLGPVRSIGGPSLETLWLQNIRTMDKVQIIDHSNTAHRQKHLEMNLFYCFYAVILDLYRENLVTLGGKSCSSSRELGSDNCVQLYQ